MRHTADLSNNVKFDMTEEEMRAEMNPIYTRISSDARDEKMKKILYVGFGLTATAITAGGAAALYALSQYYK